jgi:non-heme chloroperoxidase
VQVLLVAICGLVFAIIVALAGMIALGTGDPPKALASIGKPFESVDFRDLPVIERITARGGTPLAFRRWEPSDANKSQYVVIANHGSSASSSSLHPLGKALSMEGLSVYAPDIRGHGDTGQRGDIDYAGQLDDDLFDFTAAVKAQHPAARLVLLGFSSGGGFALHATALPLGKTFERTVLLSPMLGVQAPTVKAGGDAWAKPFMPRIIALSLLDRIGIHAFEHLPVVAFAIAPERADILTGHYSFVLMRGFGTTDYAADLRNAPVPIAVLVGEKDELFDASLFAPTIQAVRPDVPVKVIPGLSHIEMITDPRAIPSIAASIRGS